MVICIRIRRKICAASSPSSSILSLTRMDSLPDEVVQHILSKLSNAMDVASCKCVSKKWKHLTSYHKRLSFPGGIFENLTGPRTPDSIVMQMVSSVSQLEELVVSCPFTDAGLDSLLLAVGSSLQKLELRFTANEHCRAEVECLRAARNLRSLCLWCVIITRSPKWDVFNKLQELEIHGAKLEDSGFTEALRATPYLTRLVVSDCHGLTTVCIELLELQHCQFDHGYSRDVHVRSLTLKAPKIQSLKVHGCNCIRVDNVNCLKTLSINTMGFDVATVELGDDLMALESVSIRGNEWRSDLMSKILQVATQLRYLFVGVICIKDLHEVVCFPEIGFVDFFKSHPKLKTLDISGGMIDALFNNHMASIKNVDSSFVIPCIEKVSIALKGKQISDAKTKSRMIEWLLKCGNKLKKININVQAYKTDVVANNFSMEIHRLLHNSSTQSRVIPR